MKKLILLLSIVLLSSYAQAKWKNPSERYSDAYKKYTKARCPIAHNNIHNFVYFSKNREQIKDHLFLSHQRFSGAPDLMVKRKGQLNHALAMMHENKYTVPLGIAIQDGNYIGFTGADGEKKSQSVKKIEKTLFLC